MLCSKIWKEKNFKKVWKPKLTETMKAHHLIMCNLAKKKEEGFKLGLIIGRSPNEYIPEEKNWIWATLDKQPLPEEYPEYAMKCAKKEEDKKSRYYYGLISTRDKGVDCYHFNIDINTNEFIGYTGEGEWRSFISKAIMMFKGFDQVVMDLDTLKFLRRPHDFKVWETLKDLLNKNKESRLIVELVPNIVQNKNRCFLNKWMPVNIDSLDRLDVENNLIYVTHHTTSVLRKGYIKLTIEYLQKLFDKVDVYNSGAVYPTRKRDKMSKVGHRSLNTFVICTGPKKDVLFGASLVREREELLQEARELGMKYDNMEPGNIVKGLIEWPLWFADLDKQKKVLKKQQEKIHKIRKKAEEREKTPNSPRGMNIAPLPANKAGGGAESRRPPPVARCATQQCTYDFSGWGQYDYVRKDGECSNQCPLCVNNICEEGNLKSVWQKNL